MIQNPSLFHLSNLCFPLMESFLCRPPASVYQFMVLCVCAGLVAQLCLTLCEPMDCSLQAPLSMRFPGKNTGVGCHSLFQGIIPIQGLNLDLLHCRQICYQLSHQGSPYGTIIALYYGFITGFCHLQSLAVSTQEISLGEAKFILPSMAVCSQVH